MIAKHYTTPPPTSDPCSQAGANAERQMAFYLHRRFAEDPDVHVLHDLYLRDAEQPEHTGSTGTCQIDHLLIHRWGMFIVKSKSVTSEVRVRPDGSEGDEWTRVWNGAEQGIPSPIQQAKRQGHFLRTYLQRHRLELLGRQPVGLRTLAKVTAGTDQRGFRNVPIQVVVAFSDSGRIRRLDGWKEPEELFGVFVTKADLVPDKVTNELTRHREGASLLGNPLTRGAYGLWEMSEPEAAAVAAFLAEVHQAADPACGHCASKDLIARRVYSYYWQCRACQKNTPMPTVCRSCGAEGYKDSVVRIRKDGSTYFRDCERCGHCEPVWTVT